MRWLVSRGQLCPGCLASSGSRAATPQRFGSARGVCGGDLLWVWGAAWRRYRGTGDRDGDGIAGQAAATCDGVENTEKQIRFLASDEGDERAKRYVWSTDKEGHQSIREGMWDNL